MFFVRLNINPSPWTWAYLKKKWQSFHSFLFSCEIFVFATFFSYISYSSSWGRDWVLRLRRTITREKTTLFVQFRSREFGSWASVLMGSHTNLLSVGKRLWNVSGSFAGFVTFAFPIIDNFRTNMFWSLSGSELIWRLEVEYWSVWRSPAEPKQWF